MNKKNEGIGKRIRDIRKRAGMTQGDLGRRLGVTASSVSSYESGEYSPSTECLVEIAKIGGTSIDWLLTGEGEPNQPITKTRTLEDLVREDAEEWPPSATPPSDFEVRVIGMLRRIGPKERQHILNLITNAYYDEVEGIKPKE